MISLAIIVEQPMDNGETINLKYNQELAEVIDIVLLWDKMKTDMDAYINKLKADSYK